MILAVGACRGGTASQGGPLWLDWNEEFEAIRELPQIVGHTRSISLRQRENSFCIDCSQTSIFHLFPDATLSEFRIS